MKARGRAASLAFPAGPALIAAAVLALGVPMVRLAPSYPDTAPGGGAPWQVALQAAAAASAVIAGAALAAHRATALCGTLLMLAGPAVVNHGERIRHSRPGSAAAVSSATEWPALRIETRSSPGSSESK